MVSKPSPKALYPNPNARPHWYTPRNLGGSYNRNSYTFIDPSERQMLAAYAMDLYCSLPSLGSGINAKNNWSFAAGWRPTFKGKDKEWGKLATDYLLETVFPSCNVLGANYNFNRTLAVMGNAYDVSGETMAAFVTDRNNDPKISIIPSNRIGQRGVESEVKEGRYKGNKIQDGVIIAASGRPIAYRILGDDYKGTEDYDLPAYSGMLLFEPEHVNQYRGVTIVARSILSFLNVQDIENYLSRIVKLESMVGVIASVDGGDGKEFRDSFGSVGSEEVTTTNTDKTSTPPVYSTSEGGEMFFINSTAGEKLEAFRTDRPHTNTQEFLYNIEEKALYSVGWPLPLISTQKINSVAARQLESQIRQTIKSRQETMKKFAKTFCIFAISKGIENGVLKASQSDDWRKWDFSMPGLFTIDSYYSEQSDREGWKAGSTSLAEIASKKGEDWQELREQREIEDKDLIDRANSLVAYAVSKGQELSFNRAMDMVSGKTINAAPVQEQWIEATTTTK